MLIGISKLDVISNYCPHINKIKSIEILKIYNIIFFVLLFLDIFGRNIDDNVEWAMA
jgi:hypothetical protein